MTLLSGIAFYLLTGLILTFLFDCLLVSIDPKDKLTLAEMAWVMVFWPVFCLIFLGAFFQGLFDV